MIIKAPWYISIPLLSWFVNAAIGQGWICPVTAVENRYRKKVGYPQIDTFVKHYYIKPYMRYKIKSKIRSAKKDTIKFRISIYFYDPISFARRSKYSLGFSNLTLWPVSNL